MYSDGSVRRSVDELPWELVTLDPQALVTAGAALSPAVCWFVGRDGAVFVTVDGGERFAVSGVAGGAAGDVSSHPRPEAARAPHVPAPPTGPNAFPLQSGERYAHVAPNRFQSTRLQPLSTFGADVDTASYANVRRFLSVGQLPPPDAVRVEELINYFRFDYAQPPGGGPVALTTEIGDCPWAPRRQ